MSKLLQYRDIEKNIEQLQAQLASLKQNEGLTKELEFEAKFNQLLEEYGFDKKTALRIIAPELGQASAATATAPKRRERAVKVYKNPHNGDVVETKGGNHKVLKSWKEEYGADVVESWLQK